jgi:hypothetical protein
VIVLSRKCRRGVWLRNIDRLIFVWLYRFFPAILNAITVGKPETVIRWHWRGFRAYWHWKSRRRGGRPKIDRESPRPHPTDQQGEPSVGSAADTRRTVNARDQGRPINRGEVHGQKAGASFPELEDIPAQSRRWDCVHRSVRGPYYLLQVALWPGHSSPRPKTNNPTANWIAGQLTNAFPWDEAPLHLIRDRDGAFGPTYARRTRAMGIRDRPTAPGSPVAERLR